MFRVEISYFPDMNLNRIVGFFLETVVCLLWDYGSVFREIPLHIYNWDYETMPRRFPLYWIITLGLQIDILGDSPTYL